MMTHVPGVVDLCRQSRRSLNYLQGAVDYWQNATPYFNLKYDAPGARFQHNHWDHSENPGRNLYGTVLARIVSGIEDELPAEKCWKELIYRSIPEGEALSFRPNPSPYDVSREARDITAEQTAQSVIPRLEADLWDNRSVLTGLLLSYENTGDERAYEVARNMVRRIQEVPSWEGECAFFQTGSITPGWKPVAGSEPVMGQNMGGWISPLLHYFKLSGDESALHLARGLGKAFLAVYPETLLATAKTIEPMLHVNSHAAYFLLAGLVRLYRVTGERAFLDWARWQFDGLLTHLCSATGWTAEFMPWQTRKGGDSCETCSLADRIDVDIQLALAGYPQYWNDAQRCACNYLVEAQLHDTAWMPVDESLLDDFYISTYRIRERAVGAYVGWGAPNDFVDPDARVLGRVQNCCAPHGAFAVYQLWHYAVERTDPELRVHLALSRDTPWCTVLTRAPVEGKLDIRMKIDAPLAIRLPDWLNPNELRVTQGGAACAFTVTAGYARLTAKAGGTVCLSYPMRRTKLSERLSGHNYATEWVDDYVMAIHPPGKVAPLFQRDPVKIAAAYEQEPVWPKLVPEIEW